jgi:sugar-specific transcriptional regulator TrmB
MLREDLISLHITPLQADIYLALLEFGSASVQDVAERAGVKRTSVYNVLDDMKSRGLLTVLDHSGRKLLVAESPENIVAYEQKQARKAQDILPELSALYALPGAKPKARYYEGIAGLKQMYDATIVAGESIVAFSDYEKMFAVMTKEYMYDYALRRAEAGVTIRSIAKPGVEAIQVSELDADQKRETRIYAGDFEFDTEINIYGNHVAFFSFRRPYAGVIIEDRAVATTMRSIWNIVWNTLETKKSPHGN